MKVVIKKVVILISGLFVQTAFGQAVFQSFDVVVSDPGAVVAAMDKYAASPTGSSLTSTIQLYRYVAAGDNEATHAINVVHPSPSDMDSNLMAAQGSQDQATLFAEIAQSARIINRWMGQILLSGGSAANITSPNPAAQVYMMSVSDPAAYAPAFASFIGKNSDVGQSFLSSIIADGENPATHVVLNFGNSMGELLMNQPQTLEGWDEYVANAGDNRTVEATAMLQLVKFWAPE